VCSSCDRRSSLRPRMTSGCAGFRLKGHIQAGSTLPRVCLRPPTEYRAARA
jgi:hypothetical protein